MASSGGGYGGGDEEAQMIVGINVTPLVDIALVLLITFMVTAGTIVSPAIRVDLPKAASGSDSAKTSLVLTIAKDGKLHLNGTASNDGAVATFIREELPKNPDLQAVIAADRAVPHGDVVHVMDLVKTAGVRRFAINVDPAAGAPAAQPLGDGPAR